MVGNLTKVQEAVHRLASLVDDAVAANRFYGLKAKSAVLECLADGEWWSMSQFQERRATGFPGGGVVYRRCREKRRNERGRGW